MHIAQPEPSSPDSRPKTVLFCPDCGHESRVDGDWSVSESGRQTAFECPDCGSTIASRSRSRRTPAQ